MARKGNVSTKKKQVRHERLVGRRRDRVIERTETLMVQLYPPSEVSSILKDEFDLTATQCRKLTEAVRKKWREEDSTGDGLTAAQSRAVYKAEQVRRLMNLYRAAYARRKYGECLRIETLLARMHGTLEAAKLKLQLPALPVALPKGAKDEFDGRSEADNAYYALKGFWPEDGGEMDVEVEITPPPAAPAFPLPPATKH